MPISTSDDSAKLMVYGERNKMIRWQQILQITNATVQSWEQLRSHKPNDYTESTPASKVAAEKPQQVPANWGIPFRHEYIVQTSALPPLPEQVNKQEKSVTCEADAPELADLPRLPQATCESAALDALMQDPVYSAARHTLIAALAFYDLESIQILLDKVSNHNERQIIIESYEYARQILNVP